MALGLPYFSLPVTDSSELRIEEHARLVEEEEEIVKHREDLPPVDAKILQEEKVMPLEQYDYSQLQNNSLMNQGTLSGLLSQTSNHYTGARGQFLVG